MALVAVTNIKHGDKEGNVTVIDAGDEVTGISGDDLKQLQEAGSVVEAREYAVLQASAAASTEPQQLSDDALKLEFLRRFGGNMSESEREEFLAYDPDAEEPENEE